MRHISEDVQARLTWAGIVSRDAGDYNLEFRRITDDSHYVILKVSHAAGLDADAIINMCQRAIHRDYKAPLGYFRHNYRRLTLDELVQETPTQNEKPCSK